MEAYSLLKWPDPMTRVSDCYYRGTCEQRTLQAAFVWKDRASGADPPLAQTPLDELPGLPRLVSPRTQPLAGRAGSVELLGGDVDRGRSPCGKLVLITSFV